MIKDLFIGFLRRGIPYSIRQKVVSSLLKLEYGGGNIRTSGELKAMKYVFGKLSLRERNQNMVLFDVGANVGNYSLELYNRFGENSDIYSFEPSMHTFKVLCDNMRSVSNIHCQNIGLSIMSWTKTLYAEKEGDGTASVYHRRLDHFDIHMDVTQECQFTTLDSFCNENGISRVNFLKIDVEGHELSVLQGAKEILSRGGIDFIQFEFGGCDIDSRTFFQDFWYLLGEKYVIYKIVPNGLYQIKKYSETQEIFICQNFLAELCMC